MAKRPLLLADEALPDERFVNRNEYIFEEHDASYIPGYAEVVKANHIASSRRLTSEQKEVYFQRWKTGPKKLPIEFVWLRVTNAAGGVSHSAAVDRMVYVQAGYRACKAEDYKQLMEEYPGILTGTPWEDGSATLEADGTIRRLDSALFVVKTDDPRYLAWQRRRAEDNAQFENFSEPSGPHGYAKVEDSGNFEAAVVER